MRGRMVALGVVTLALSGCASYDAHRSTDTFTASDYVFVKPMASVDEALKTFQELKPFYSGGQDYHIQVVMADRSNVRFHESAIVTEQRQDVTESSGSMWFGLDYVPQNSTETTTRNVDVTKERNVWIPVDKISSIFMDGYYYSNPQTKRLGISYIDSADRLDLTVSDVSAAQKLADAMATLRATHFDSQFRYVPDTGLFNRKFEDTAEWSAQDALEGECDRLDYDDCEKAPPVLVDGVAPGSPAAAAGIAVDDLIVTIDGQPAGEFGKIIAAKVGRRSQATYDLKVFRAGRMTSVTLVLDNPVYQRAEQWAKSGVPAPASAAQPFGVSARELDAAEAGGAGISGGVFVIGVKPGSVAERLGVRAGDYIAEINGIKVSGLEALKQTVAIGAVKTAKVWREGRMVDLGVGTEL